MLVFVNNIPVYILEKSSKLNPTINLSQNTIEFEKLEGTPVIENASETEIISFFHFLQTNSIHKVENATFLVKKKSAFKKYLKTNLNFVKAAGGVVENHDHKILLMKRLGFWDLPKGKAEKKEKSDKTAIREVEEECGVSVFIYKKIATTWHTYFNKGNLTIKRTKWYSMGLISDLKMKPQTEEGIEELKWMTEKEVEEAVLNSYESIRFVIKSWHQEKIN